MDTTPGYALPFVEPTDQVTDYPATSEALALAVEAALGGNIPWTIINLAVGFRTTAVGNEPSYRVHHGVVYFRGYVERSTGTNFAASTAYTIAAAAAMPVGARPEKQSGATKVLAGSTANGQVKAWVDPDGSITLTIDPTAQPYVALAGLSGYIGT